LPQKNEEKQLVYQTMSKRRKKKNIFKRNLPLIILIALLAGGFYYYINYIEKQEIIEAQTYETSEPYHLLENKDSTLYIESILLNKNASILQISEAFYNSDIYWPYIFQANKIEGNILNLENGTILNIPKISTELLDAKNEENIARVKHLSDSLLEDINKKRKAELEKDNLMGW